VWVGFDPRHKVMVNFVVGRHNQSNANKLVAGIKSRSDGHVPLFTSDERKHYDDALLDAYGIKHESSPCGEIRNPKFEIRNKFKYQMTQIQNVLVLGF